MGAAIQKLDFVLGGVLRVVFYRTLHLVSVPFPIKDVLAYAKENANGEGTFAGTLHEVRTGPIFSTYRWDNIQMGEGLPMDVYFFGFTFGTQTVIVRRRFYLGNFTRRLSEKAP